MDPWAEPLVVRVYGYPVAQARAGRRLIAPKDGRPPFVHSYDPPAPRDWKRTVAARVLELRGDRPMMVEGPILMVGTFFLMRPLSLPRRVRYPTTKPDLDNLEKAVLDALTGVLYRSDAQVVDKHFRKAYVTQDPGLEFWIGRPPDRDTEPLPFQPRRRDQPELQLA